MDQKPTPAADSDRLSYHGLTLLPGPLEVGVSRDDFIREIVGLSQAEWIVFDTFRMTPRLPTIKSIADRCGDIGFSEARVEALVQRLIRKRVVCRRVLKSGSGDSIAWYETAPLIRDRAAPSEHPPQESAPTAVRTDTHTAKAKPAPSDERRRLAIIAGLRKAESVTSVNELMPFVKPGVSQWHVQRLLGALVGEGTVIRRDVQVSPRRKMRQWLLADAATQRPV